MGPTRWGSDDDPERTEVVPQRAARQLPPRDVDPDKTVVIAPSHGAPDETTTPVAPGYPPAPSGYPVGAYHQQSASTRPRLRRFPPRSAVAAGCGRYSPSALLL